MRIFRIRKIVGIFGTYNKERNFGVFDKHRQETGIK